MSRQADIRNEVELVLRRVLEDTGRAAHAVRDDEKLSEQIGLDSLDLAQVVVMLEQQFGVDPFRKPNVVVRTFGDLVKVYSEAVERQQPTSN